MPSLPGHCFEVGEIEGKSSGIWVAKSLSIRGQFFGIIGWLFSCVERMLIDHEEVGMEEEIGGRKFQQIYHVHSTIDRANCMQRKKFEDLITFFLWRYILAIQKNVVLRMFLTKMDPTLIYLPT